MTSRRTTVRLEPTLMRWVKERMLNTGETQQDIMADGLELLRVVTANKTQVLCPGCQNVSTVVRSGNSVGLVPFSEQNHKTLDMPFCFIPESTRESHKLQMAIRKLIDASSKTAKREMLLYDDVLTLVNKLLTPYSERKVPE